MFFDKGCHPADGRSKVTYEDMGSDIRANHERLGVGYTDLFVLHRDDPDVPVDEIVGWLNDYKDQGLIGGFGGSNWHYTRIAAANEWAAANGKQAFSLDNPNLTLAENVEPLWDGCITIDREGRDWHERTQLPLFAWASMARGYFFGVDDPEVLRAYDSPDEPSAPRARTAARRRARLLGARGRDGLGARATVPRVRACGAPRTRPGRRHPPRARARTSPQKTCAGSKKARRRLSVSDARDGRRRWRRSKGQKWPLPSLQRGADCIHG